MLKAAALSLALVGHVLGYSDDPLASCPGYKATHVKKISGGIHADLTLAGKACDTYGTDLKNLKLDVTYESETRLHVKIQDAGDQVYQVPESVFPRPGGSCSEGDSNLKFDFVAKPFSFSVSRKDTGEKLFDTSAASLVFQSQFLRLRTSLPNDPYLYGLGEHTDSFRLNNTDYIRTLWSADQPLLPQGQNLYGNHPLYVDHREDGTHGVFLLNSNGMDIRINSTDGGQYLEYNTIGGVLDFYFLAGPSPMQVSKQYAEVAGLPAMVGYSSFGLHQCRWGYQDIFEVAEVVYNYSQAGIPLETMWTDIDYMDYRRIFTLDKERFPLKKVRQLVDYLHDHDQKYTVMVDPAVAYKDYPTFNRGVKDDVFLKRDGEIWKGVVWPGVTAFPDWFADNIESYWNNEFETFFSESDGVDIDFLWIDMNEPSSFGCTFPCDDPEGSAEAGGLPPDPPPVREPPRELPGFPCDFQPSGTDCEDLETRSPPSIGERQAPLPTHNLESVVKPRSGKGNQKGLPGRDLLFPKYSIHNYIANDPSWNGDKGGLSNKTVETNVKHQNGLALYDTHNLYGSMMSSQSRTAMLARRPNKRPLVITRSTFAGIGAHVGHWLGDNGSDWPFYKYSVKQMLEFAAMFQVPMVGSDVCGFGLDTTEELCARWAMIGAFNPFYRNHNSAGQLSQEFYRWPSVTEAAKKAIDIRYRLLDYIYTAFYQQTQDGTPLLTPMFFQYPEDKATWELDMQFFYGPGLLVAPVPDKGMTSADVYLPDDVFYDWFTQEAVTGDGKTITVKNQTLTDIPLFVRGGVIIPMRRKSGMTTTDVRKEDFELLIPLNRDGSAEGSLYLDDGESIKQDGTSMIRFTYKEGKLHASGSFGCHTESKITKITVLDANGISTKKKTSVVKDVDQSLNGKFKLDLDL